MGGSYKSLKRIEGPGPLGSQILNNALGLQNLVRRTADSSLR